MCFCWFCYRNFKIIKSFIGLHVNYPIFLSDFNEIWIFSTYFRRITHISKFIKIRPLVDEMFHEDRRTSITKQIIAIRNFANAPEDHSFPQTRRLKCCNAFVINVLSTGLTKRFNLYWTTQVIFD